MRHIPQRFIHAEVRLPVEIIFHAEGDPLQDVLRPGIDFRLTDLPAVRKQQHIDAVAKASGQSLPTLMQDLFNNIEHAIVK